jgi:hypothetical protein
LPAEKRGVRNPIKGKDDDSWVIYGVVLKPEPI